MLRSEILLGLLVILLNNCLSLGINQEKKIDNIYIIDVTSEDLSKFTQKLDSFLNEVQNDYHSFLIRFGIMFISTYIIIIKLIFKQSNKMLIFLILGCFSFKLLSNKYRDYNLGIKSAKNAINNFHITMNSKRREVLDLDDPKKLKYKTEYVGDEINKYGLHAVFCEIPGKLPSKNANPQSYEHLIGGDCYEYFSQRRFYDTNDISYVGNEKAENHKIIKENNLNIFLNNF